MASVTQRVLEQYPSLSFLLKDKEIGPLLRDAVDPNKGFSPQTFQAKLYQTKWWRSRSETARTWEIQANTDPGEASRQLWALRHAVRGYATQLGVNLTNAEVQWMATVMAKSGITDPSDRQIRTGIMQIASKGGRIGPAAPGAIMTAKEQIAQFGRDQYYKAFPSHVTNKWAKWIAFGEKTMEDFQTSIHREAMKRFPHLRSQLAQGLTVADVVDPFRELVANELEFSDLSQVDVVSNPKWRQLLGIKDPKTGKMRMPTESDVINLARTEKSWWKTSKGRQMDSEAARSVLTMMGARR